MRRDLVVLVPDKDIEQALCGLLSRRSSLGIRAIAVADIIVHPNRDPGVYNTGHALLQLFAHDTEHALIVFDRAWDGAPSADAAELATHVERLCARDWNDRVRCVCIEPEIEKWVWSDSPHVPAALGWRRTRELRAWLEQRQLWPAGALKPSDPKVAFELAVAERNIVPSSAIFRTLAQKVGINRCRDASFLLLLQILRGWFAIPSEPA